MPAVSTYSPSGNSYVDGVLSGQKWAIANLTFSFPTQASYYGTGYGSGEPGMGFEALNATQQTAARAVLSQFAAVANLNFTLISETSTQHADLRFAESDVPGTAWAYYPHTSAEGGDVWLNNSKNYYDNPVKGNYAYTTFLHEIGHALGLKHPHEASGSFGAMPLDRDSMEYTVMSYRSYTGQTTSGGYTNETWGYAQSLMMYDIAAAQRMYGANYNTNSGNTTYTWSPTTGAMSLNGVSQGAPGGNKVFLTVWDGGGTDTYDLSNYSTNLKLDLRPGEWTTTSTAQLAKLHYDGSKVATGNIANALLYGSDLRSLIENATGGSGSDSITGNIAANVLRGGAGDDRLIGGGGNDTLYGDTGSDTAVFSGSRSQYGITQLADGSLRVADLRSGSPDSADILWGVESLQFTDKLYTLQEITPDTNTVTSEPPPNGLTLTGTSANNTLKGASGDDKIYGLSGSDALYGYAGNDLLDGGASKDSLYGGDGHDMLVGGGGSDLLDGGLGIDAAIYANATAAVTANLTSSWKNTGHAYGDRYVSIEDLFGSSYADALTGNDVGNLIDGGAGGDKLYGLAGDDRLVGGGGNDILDGGLGTDKGVFSGLMANYSWSKNSDGSWTIRDLRAGSPDGTDRLISIETLQFSDSSVALASSASSAASSWNGRGRSPSNGGSEAFEAMEGLPQAIGPDHDSVFRFLHADNDYLLV